MSPTCRPIPSPGPCPRIDRRVERLEHRERRHTRCGRWSVRRRGDGDGRRELPPRAAGAVSSRWFRSLLPEVEALADHLRRHAVGLTIGRVELGGGGGGSFLGERAGERSACMSATSPLGGLHWQPEKPDTSVTGISCPKRLPRRHRRPLQWVRSGPEAGCASRIPPPGPSASVRPRTSPKRRYPRLRPCYR